MPKPPAAAPKVPKSSKIPAIFLPTVRIEHVNLRLIQKNGTLRVEDFSLILDPAKPGVISVTRLSIPGVPELNGVKGVLRERE